MRPDIKRRQAGAALLLVLAVVGVGAAAVLITALGRLNPEARRERITVQQLGLATDALVGYAAAHGRLPRPAQSAMDGSEDQRSCANNAARCTGFLPWVTLGVAGSDSWGKLLRYSVTPGLTEFSFTSATLIATKTVQQRTPDGGLNYLIGQDRCTLNNQCAPFVVYSNGKNNLGTSSTGLPQVNADAGNVDELFNDAATERFIQRVATQDARQAGGRFDDLLAWIPLSTLYARMRAARTLP